MKKKYKHFVPGPDSEKSPWAGNIAEKISSVGVILGLSAATITKVEDAALNIKNTVDTVEVRKRDLEKAVAAKEQSLQEDVKVILAAAAVMKRHPDYRVQLGSDLGIVGYTVVYDEKDLRPNIAVRAFEGRVEVSFDLQLMNSITIFSRIKGTNGWDKLGNDYASPFEDRRPLQVAHQAEIREYAAMYFNGKEEVGQMSQIETLVFGG